jgi:hypothetical protein
MNTLNADVKWTDSECGDIVLVLPSTFDLEMKPMKYVQLFLDHDLLI